MSVAPIPPLEFQRLQPVVLLDGMALLPGAESGTALVTPGGARMPLRPYCPITTVSGHCRRAQSPDLLAIATALDPRAARDDAHALAAFLDVLAPAFEHWTAKCPAAAGPPSEVPPAPELPPDLARAVPDPELPQPSLLVFGRYWLLASGNDAPKMRVVDGRRTLAVTGRHVAARDLAAQWAEASFAALRAELRRRAQPPLPESPDFAAALAQFRKAKACERGDLVLLSAHAPLIGHILPDHYNSSLGRRCDRSLAVCSPLALPGTAAPDRGALCVFERAGAGWSPAHLEHGICLGPAPEAAAWAGAPRSLAPLLFLRFAAIRFAGNGRFHEHDNH